MRRNRMQSFSRRLMAESSLSVDDLIWPMFIIEGQDIDEPIASMPGQYRYSIDRLIEKSGLIIKSGTEPSTSSKPLEAEE